MVRFKITFLRKLKTLVGCACIDCNHIKHMPDSQSQKEVSKSYDSSNYSFHKLVKLILIVLVPPFTVSFKSQDTPIMSANYGRIIFHKITRERRRLNYGIPNPSGTSVHNFKDTGQPQGLYPLPLNTYISKQ